MGEPARILRSFGRREFPRYPLGMPARLIVPDGTLVVVLDDLSLGGARVTLPEEHPFTVCVLRWMDHHCFAEVRWRHELAVGLQFDKLLDAETLAQSCHYAHDRQGRFAPQGVRPRYC
jgi:hypothetical protein